MMSSPRRIWVALDVPDQHEAERLMEHLSFYSHFKVGMELFYRIGPRAVEQWVATGHNIFLDLKLFDIPNTVRRALQQIADLGVHLTTIHAAGGKEMLQAASERRSGLAVVAVTALTSMDGVVLQTIGVSEPVPAWVHRLARLSQENGLDGVVLSGEEVQAINATWPSARLVVPGIRLRGMAHHDQKRVVTPEQAFERGATDLVIGRAIRQAPDPAQALHVLIDALEERGFTVE